ncbi:hypothetical protein MMC20_001930 [Loxospora ochrophaea]|nr:hypothetical protein [Loxospora ochrophaea]
MPQLESLKITDIDPLCYPDDLSVLLAGSKNLTHLKLHWSPRMRNDREPSIILNAFFGKLAATGRQLRLKSVAFQNLYAQNDGGFGSLFDPSVIEEITFFNSIGGIGESPDMSFVEHSWQMSPKHPHDKKGWALKMARVDKISRDHCNFFGLWSGLERLYLITGRDLSKRDGSSRLSSSTPGANCNGPATPSTPPDPVIANLGQDYLDVILRCHGSTLRHLLLMPHWLLSNDELVRLVRCCPNLEQLGLCADVANFKLLRLMLPFLPRLKALRILDGPDDWRLTDKMIEKGDDTQKDGICTEICNETLDCPALTWVGLGDLIYELGQVAPVESEDKGKRESLTRKVRRGTLEDVKDVEIWSMDRLEIY